jgi:hypothetical protein
MSLQSYSAVEANRRFHFTFSTVTTGVIGDKNPISLLDIAPSTTEFNFCNPIVNLSSITLSFGSPFYKLEFDADRLPAIISADGTDTLFTFSTDHKLKLGDVVYVVGFETFNVLDGNINKLINDIYGLTITDLTTSSSFKVAVDISGLLGAIKNNPYMVYFESKRFIARIELSYIM